MTNILFRPEGIEPEMVNGGPRCSANECPSCSKYDSFSDDGWCDHRGCRISSGMPCIPWYKERVRYLEEQRGESLTKLMEYLRYATRKKLGMCDEHGFTNTIDERGVGTHLKCPFCLIASLRKDIEILKDERDSWQDEHAQLLDDVYEPLAERQRLQEAIKEVEEVVDAYGGLALTHPHISGWVGRLRTILSKCTQKEEEES